MNDRNLVRGLFLLAIALTFGLGSLRYPLGDFTRPGAGMFALLVSSLLFLIGLITVVRSRLVERVPLGFGVKNIALVMAGLAGFALLSQHVNMIAGIVFMVFCAGYAGTSNSIARNIKVSLGLIAVAFAFQQLLGLSLRLY